MKFFLQKFRTDKYFLPWYFSLQLISLLGLILLLYQLDLEGTYNQSLSRTLAFVLIALVLGIKIPTTMHNCFHHNLKSASLVIGEITSLFVLLSYGIMCINHAYHHAHADSDLDPHNPEGKSFLKFFFTSTFSGIDIIEDSYLKIFGESKETKLIFKTSIFLHLLGIPVRLVFWYLLLGKYLFLCLYLPAFSIYIFSFAHVNYVTHQTDETGKVSILNINSNPWYKIVNFFGDGVYFHKNHHLKPGLYNPMKLEMKE